jgi:hypothetical protein
VVKFIVRLSRRKKEEEGRKKKEEGRRKNAYTESFLII